jgi:hypothetical protein
MDVETPLPVSTEEMPWQVKSETLRGITSNVAARLKRLGEKV